MLPGRGPAAAALQPAAAPGRLHGATGGWEDVTDGGHGAVMLHNILTHESRFSFSLLSVLSAVCHLLN